MRHSGHLHLPFHTHHRPARYDVDMTKGSITKHLINFALPLMVGNLFQQLYNMVDTWVVGNFVSNEAFSAVGTVTPIINMLIGFFLGLSSGAGVVISQYYGAQREEKVKQAVHTSLLLTLLLGVVFTAADGTQLTGQTSIKYTVLSLVSASNLDVISRLDGDLTVGWDAPDTPVESWTVRCYSDDYDETQTVTGTIAIFQGTNDDKAYTVEVTPAGMTQPTRLNISANPITVTAFHFEEDDEGGLDVSWDYDGKSPEGGWLLMYTMNNSDASSVIKCAEAKGTITPLIPETTYNVTLQLTTDTSLFGASKSYTTAPAEAFSTQGLSADKIQSRLLKTPDNANWLADNVKDEDCTTTFTSGDKISMILDATVKFYVDHEDINVMYVYRDSDGNPLPSLISEETIDWYDLFYDGKYQLGELDLPKAPTQSGDYTITVYFNGSPVASNSFTIS